jgi:conjugal transfer pilus assembly protein TraB
MEARLLTGFDASTSGDGKNNPEPLLLRIQAPAMLPNDVKANLRGCFIIAEAVGRLNKERADVRLVSLSCIGRKGQAVIDSTVKGFVTDSDSKVGLSGRVVSKMGAATARAVVAGIFGGAGDALQASPAFLVPTVIMNFFWHFNAVAAGSVHHATPRKWCNLENFSGRIFFIPCRTVNMFFRFR